MSVMELGALGEFVGAFAVVVTLVYLAIQVRDNSKFIRENTESLRATNEIKSNDFTSGFITTMFNNPELIELHARGDKGEALDGLERSKYQMLLRMSFEGHQTFFVQHNRGLTGDEIWNYWSGAYDRLLARPGVERWWAGCRSHFDPAFRAYIDNKL